MENGYTKLHDGHWYVFYRGIDGAAHHYGPFPTLEACRVVLEMLCELMRTQEESMVRKLLGERVDIEALEAVE